MVPTGSINLLYLHSFGANIYRINLLYLHSFGANVYQH